MILENTNPATAAQFRALVERGGVTLPLHTSFEPGQHGPVECIFDARERLVIEIDPDETLGDDQVKRLALAIVIAMNTCAGFKATKGGGEGQS